MASTTRTRRGRADDARSNDYLFDRKLDHPEALWCEWMTQRGGDHLAASEPVGRETLARIGGKSCSIDLLINDIREEPRGRSYDLFAVAGGWKHLTRLPAPARSARLSAAASAPSIWPRTRCWC